MIAELKITEEFINIISNPRDLKLAVDQRGGETEASDKNCGSSVKGNVIGNIVAGNQGS